MNTISPKDTPVELLLNQLKLKAFIQNYESMQTQAVENTWSNVKYLSKLCELEVSRRYQNRVKRWMIESRLPAGKSFATFKMKELPSKVTSNIVQLQENVDWVSKAENILLLGPSGVGKSHIAAALGRHLIENNIRIKWFNANDLLQQLQNHKKELQLMKYLSQLDKYSVIIVDDIGYIKKTESESSVLFEFIAHRYESGSLIITSNQAFSQWDQIFPDNMMTVAAIDRIIHHASVIEIDTESYRKKNHKELR
jgi:DNA replication protein DnaC